MGCPGAVLVCDCVVAPGCEPVVPVEPYGVPPFADVVPAAEPVLAAVLPLVSAPVTLTTSPTLFPSSESSPARE